LIVCTYIGTMEAPKEDPVTSVLDNSAQPLLSDQDSRPPTPYMTKQDAPPSTSIKTPISDRPSTAATSIGTKEAGSVSTESRTHSPNPEQQTKPPGSSGKESKEPSAEDALLLSKDPFGSEQSKALFDAIDELRICGAGQDLDLPQVSHRDAQLHLLNLTQA
jgi:hypothetical protein